MPNLVPIIILAILITALILFSLSLGYVIRRRSERAGIVFAGTGSLCAVVLVVNYFEVVPVIIIGASFAAFAGALLYAAFEVARKDPMQHPS
jgi:hypothetical protein